jgi:hypothetical protein
LHIERFSCLMRLGTAIFCLGGNYMRMRVSLLICGLAASVALAAPVKHRLDNTKIDTPNMQKSRIASVLSYLSKSHSGIYIPPEHLFKCDDEAACEAKGELYYKRIGVFDAAGNPTAARGTMQAWLATNGFSLNPTTPSPGEIRAVYYNRADLGFGRDLHCKSRAVGAISTESAVKNQATVSARAAGGAVFANQGGTMFACYVTNYGDNANPFKASGNEQQSIQKANTNTAPIATVAMEVYRPNAGGGTPEVRFIVYDTGGIATSGFTPVSSALKGRPLPFAILDNDTADGGKKANPGTCLNCHGGIAPDPVNSASPTMAETVITGSNFLPFDAQHFGYDSNASSPISEVNQRETMRKLNAFVKSTLPPSPAINAQIDGWYSWCSGVATAGCALDDQNLAHRYTPPSWKNATSVVGGRGGNAQIVNLYQNVARKYCSTCHLARADDYNVQEFVGPYPGSPNHDRIKSKLNPNTATSSMPLAERTFNDYWNDALAHSSYNAIWGPVLDDNNAANPN